MGVKEVWFFNVLEKAPMAPSKHQVESSFYSNAKEIEAKPLLKSLTYSYDDAMSWCDVGLQILNLSGRRPDCAVAHSVDLLRILPPRFLPGAPFIVQSPEHMRYLSTEQSQGLDIWLQERRPSLTIFVGAFYQTGLGVSSACVVPQGAAPLLQSWLS